MAERKHGTSIEWTHGDGFKGETWNPVTGCSKVSLGCDNCYAETLSLRFGWSPKPWTPENASENVQLRPERLEQPLHWKKPRMIFVNSMSDMFHELIPPSYIGEVFRVMRDTPQHIYQILTKRPKRMLEVLSSAPLSLELPLPNVWLGVSIETWRFNWRADLLREAPAAVRFISAEPLLDTLYPKDHPDRALDLKGIHWLIAGGESGTGARPMHPDWVRELRDACLGETARRYERAASCSTAIECEHGYDVCPECDARPAFFFKQWGAWAPKPEDGGGYPWRVTKVSKNRSTPQIKTMLPDGSFYDGRTLEQWLSGTSLALIGKGKAGHVLDGREWGEMPAMAA